MKCVNVDAKGKDLIDHFTERSVIFVDGYARPRKEYETEEELMNMMLNQARERSKSSTLDHLKDVEKKLLISVCAETAIVITCLGLQTTSSTLAEICKYIIAAFTAIGLISIAEIFQIKSDKNELKKYDVYLDMKDDLENCEASSEVFGRVTFGKSQEKPLNINTIDNYSLKDVERVKSLIDTIKDNGKQKVLS